ncbi:MAG: isocitrate lyase/PEP mutase family protein [Burkholderiaceae bacterium]
MTRNQQLKKLFQEHTKLRLPGAYDVLSAKLIERAGYPAVYVGSYGTAASAFGLADVGVLTLNDLTETAARIVNGVSVPVIADAEGGFFEPANIWRTVSEFERAGVSAIHIEDHAGGKHTDIAQHLVPLELMTARLKAALAARRDPDFKIVARTDAIWATHDEAEALRRVKAFIELGVDMVFPTGASSTFVENLRGHCALPIVGIETQDDAVRTPAGTADLVLNYGYCLFAATRALKSALRAYEAEPHVGALSPGLEPVGDFEALFDYHGYSRRATAFR